MKKTILLYSLLFLFTSVYAISPIKENTLVIDLKSLKSVPEDNIKIYNKSNVSSYKFAIYGYSIIADDWLPINKFQQKDMVKSPDSCHISFNFESYNVSHIAIGTNKGFITQYSTSVKNDDLVIIIENIDTSSNLIDDCTMEIPPIQHEIKKVISVPNVKKDIIYDSALSACVDFFNKSTFVIQHKDKESGTIKGKTDKYIFTIEVKDEKYRITVNDIINEKGHIHPSDLESIFNTYASYVAFSENKINSIIIVISKCIQNSDS